MKEIKFRAVIADRNAIIFFTLQDLVKPNPLFSIRELLIPWLLEGNQPDRFIELFDKNGKEIYEGDTVKEPDIYEIEYGGRLYQVVFSEGSFVLSRPHSLTETVWEKPGFPEAWEIIDNPELLETKNEEKT